VCGYVHVHALFVPVAAMMCLPVCQDVHRFVPWCALVNVSCVAAPGKCISSVIGVITRSTLCAFNNDFAYTLCLCVRVCQHVCAYLWKCWCMLVCLCVYAQKTFVYLSWSGLADLFILLLSVTISLTLWAAARLCWPCPLCVCWDVCQSVTGWMCI
jgi:hypothetical protein